MVIYILQRNLTRPGIKASFIKQSKMESMDLFGKILTDFLKLWKQRIILNSANLVGVPQGSILDPLLFLIYVNDLSDGLRCNLKLFADVTSLFATLHDIKWSNRWFEWLKQNQNHKSRYLIQIFLSRLMKLFFLTKSL